IAAPSWYADNANVLPFQFAASIIIISNDSLPRLIDTKPKIGIALAALETRITQRDVGVYGPKEQLANVFRLIRDGNILAPFGLTSEHVVQMVRWLHKHHADIRLNLRSVRMIAEQLRANPNDWQRRVLAALAVKKPRA